MNRINTYLTFNGNCREAMSFYKTCLGGELNFQTIGETPLAEKMPKKMQDCILHATLIKDQLILMGTDMASDKGLVKGNTVSLMLNCGNEKEIKKFYKKLSAGGTITHPLETTFWGAIIGNLTDKYGNNWLLHFDKNDKLN